MEAVRRIFGVTPSPPLTDSLRERGFFHFQIPRSVADATFTTADTVDFCHPARWSLRVRSEIVMASHTSHGARGRPTCQQSPCPRCRKWLSRPRRLLPPQSPRTRPPPHGHRQSQGLPGRRPLRGPRHPQPGPQLQGRGLQRHGRSSRGSRRRGPRPARGRGRRCLTSRRPATRLASTPARQAPAGCLMRGQITMWPPCRLERKTASAPCMLTGLSRNLAVARLGREYRCCRWPSGPTPQSTGRLLSWRW